MRIAGPKGRRPNLKYRRREGLGQTARSGFKVSKLKTKISPISATRDGIPYNRVEPSSRELMSRCRKDRCVPFIAEPPDRACARLFGPQVRRGQGPRQP